MSVLVILLGIGFLVALGFLLAFVWAARTGQYYDTFTPAIRILSDDVTLPPAQGRKGKTRDLKTHED